MATFRYRVKDKTGKTLDGVMNGEDEHAVANNLRSKGYLILEIKRENAYSGERLNIFAVILRWFINPIFASASAFQLAVFYRQFSTILKSGMTIAQALSMLQKQGVSWVLRRIAHKSLPIIQLGGRLSDCFSRYPWVFPELHISLLRAGEEGGNLDKILEKIADYMEHEVSIRQKLRLATFYPKILILAIIFIPKIHILFFESFNEYIRTCMQILVLILAAIFGLWVIYRILYQISAFRYVIDVIKLIIPQIGSTVRMFALARFYRVVAAMYAAGVPAGQALEHASKAAGNLYLTSRLNIAVPGVRQGEALSDSLIRTKVIPPTALEMIKTGDQTGNLDSMLEKAAEYSENEAQVATVQLTVIGGVLLFLGIAAYIGMFIANFYASYYSNIMKQP